MNKYEFFEVRSVYPQPLEPTSSAWRVTGDEFEKDFETRIKAFNYLGNLGAYLKMQTKADALIFERPLPDEGKLIQCSGCLNRFTRDKVIYVDNLPYCSHCLNDEKMERTETVTEEMVWDAMDYSKDNNSLCEICEKNQGCVNSAYAGISEGGDEGYWVCAECEAEAEQDAREWELEYGVNIYGGGDE